MSNPEYAQGIIRPYEGFLHLLKTVCGIVFPNEQARAERIFTAVSRKRQTKSIDTHLSAFDPCCCIVEDAYIDRDFMEDYASYYSRCFAQYGRTCCRVHFFGTGIDVNKLQRVLLGAENGDWRKLRAEVLQSYLGFIVFRPLPDTIYGRVCLRSVSKGDVSLATQPIKTHLFGAELEVCTMPYQEQDSVVAACATRTLWAAFQVTGRKFNHCIPSPHRITWLATHGGLCEHRAFPTKGLTIGEMGRAIAEVGLAQQQLATHSQELFRAELYAYLRLGLPVILAGAIRNPGEKKDTDNWHAVAVAGFAMSEDKDGAACNDVLLRGAAIDRLYCNDDRIGPFSEFTGEPDNCDDDNAQKNKIKWKTVEKDCLLRDQ